MEIVTVKAKFLRGVFDQNTYVLINGNEAVIVDAGAEVQDIESVVQGKKVLAVLITHLHFDHIWNIESYVQKFDCDVYVKDGCEDILGDSEKNASTMIRKNITHEIPKNHIKYYAEKLKLGSFDFDVYFTPGHSIDSVCLLTNRCLFSGDTLFEEGVGRTDIWGGNETELKKSLSLVESLDFDRAYAGHFGEFSKKQAVQEIEKNI